MEILDHKEEKMKYCFQINFQNENCPSKWNISCLPVGEIVSTKAWTGVSRKLVASANSTDATCTQIDNLFETSNGNIVVDENGFGVPTAEGALLLQQTEQYIN